MVDKIVEIILAEARTRPAKDPVQNVYDVDLEVRTKLYEIMDQCKEIQRRKKEHQNKTTNP